MHSKLPKPKTVMLIDDSAFDLKIVSRIIGHTKLFEKVLPFGAGKEALKYISSHINNADALPQLILLDIQMPEMNGFEFVEEFSALPAAITGTCRIALLSSTDDITDTERADANLYISALIKKPLHPSVLASFVEKHFEG